MTVPEVVGEVHGGHPAFTDLAFDAVAALEGCVQPADGYLECPSALYVDESTSWVAE